MPAFRTLPIRTKVTLIAVATAAAALVLTSTIFLLSTYVLIRRAVRVDLRAQAAILAGNLAAAIAFRDHEAADATLRPLDAKRTIDLTCVYDDRNALFTRYYDPAYNRQCPAVPPGDAELIQRGGVTLIRGVELDGRRVGTLYVHGNLTEVLERFQLQAAAAGISLLLGLWMAWGVARRLQRVISSPVQHLAATASRISRDNDYSVRARKSSDDELGALVDAFNAMLAQVEKRESALSQANAELSREIVERQRIEAERTELLKREREANRLKDEFLAALSHELRTPLNAILGWTQILQATADAGTTRALASIERNARAQARMIEDLLDISRIVSGKFHIKTDVVDLVAVLDAALEVVRPAVGAKGITVTRTVQRDRCFVSGDHDRLQQVFWNLLSNAVKFTPAGGAVDVRVEATGSVCSVTIADTGIGIGPEFLPHVFDRFRQADGSMAREHGGLGLGLAIVRDVVSLHGGSVDASSAGPGRGATFTVRLPQLAHAGGRAAGAEPFHAPKPLAGCAVLIVDDDADSRDIAAAALTAAGAEVSVVASGPEALERLAHHRFNVLVCDIGMPEMDGYMLLQRVRDTAGPSADIPAIALTAYASAADRKRSAAAGFEAHVAKPFSMSTLVEAVAAVSGPRIS